MATTALHPTGVPGIPWTFTAKGGAQTSSVPTVTVTADPGAPLGTGAGIPVVTATTAAIQHGTGQGIPVVTATGTMHVTAKQLLTEATFSTYQVVGMREHLRRAAGSRRPTPPSDVEET